MGQNGTVAERPIRVFGDPVLRTSCDAVGTFDAALISLVTDLEDTVSAPGRAGLAANQIGVSRRVFAYDVDGQLGHIVNPVIEATEGEQEEDEGCLSIPRLWYPLTRARPVAPVVPLARILVTNDRVTARDQDRLGKIRAMTDPAHPATTHLLTPQRNRSAAPGPARAQRG